VPHHGPVFTNMLLADEINRAPAKVQSALLEAMQEKQVTIGGDSQTLPNPFFVMATQNPVEQEGTYPLPEAQRDRFLFKLIVDYPSEGEEFEMMRRWGQVTQQPKLQPVSTGEELLEIREEVDQIHVSDKIQGYILNLVRATRQMAADESSEQHYLSYGASPRASLSLYQAGRALAWLRGQDHVTPSIVQEVFLDSMRHRVGLTYEAEAEEITADDVLKIILDRTRLPV
jgi:MoxR-like ATPase